MAGALLVNEVVVIGQLPIINYRSVRRTLCRSEDNKRILKNIEFLISTEWKILLHRVKIKEYRGVL